MTEARAAGVADSIAARAVARRLEVMNISAQQALGDGDRVLDEVVSDVKTAKAPQEALLDGRTRMAEYFAAREKNLADAESQLTQRRAMMRSGVPREVAVGGDGSRRQAQPEGGNR